MNKWNSLKKENDYFKSQLNKGNQHINDLYIETQKSIFNLIEQSLTTIDKKNNQKEM